MTQLDEARPTGAPKPRRPRYVFIFGAIAFIVFLIGLGGGGYQGKLGEVQKNDNSSFLPASAD